jgi:hypothetical protein
MTAAQLRRLQRQLRAGADGYATLCGAVRAAATGDSAAVTRALENMARINMELQTQAEMVQDPPKWLREVKL